MRINIINNYFLNVISDTLQGSIVGPVLFTCFFNDFFYVIEFENANNFPDNIHNHVVDCNQYCTDNGVTL